MALQGTLDTFALADLVRLLATTTKTGELTVDGDRGDGRLWFVDGDLVGGEPAGPGGTEDALFALLRCAEGSFRFEAEAGPDEPGTAADALDVLAAAEARLEAWRPIEALVPSPAVTLALAEDLATDEVVVSREVWRRLLVVAPGTTAAGFATALDLDEVGAATAVAELAEQGLVTIGAPEEAAEAAPEPAVEDGPLAAVEDGPLAAVEPDAWDDGVEPTDQPEAWDAVDPIDDLDSGEPTTAAWGDPLTSLPSLDEAPLAPAPALASGSLAVDLDSHLGGDVSGHSYLGGTDAAEGPEALPEPLPVAEAVPADDTDVEPVGAAIEAAEDDAVEAGIEDAPDDLVAEDEDAAWPTPEMDEDDLAHQLDALSPAAARAVAAAAASAEGDAPDEDAGRRVLRRIISSGRG